MAVSSTGLQQVATVKANLDKHRRECQNAVRDSEQLQSQLEMSQSEVRMTRMALAEKESEVTRAHDEALYVACSHHWCIAPRQRVVSCCSPNLFLYCH